MLKMQKFAATLALGFAWSACVDAGPEEDTTELEQGLEQSSTQERLHTLADRYLYEETDAAGTEEIFKEIRALSDEDARSFHELLAERNGYTGVERIAFDVAFEYAQELGISFLDLRHHEHGEQIMARLSRRTGEQAPSLVEKSSCTWPSVSCSYTTAWNYALYPGSCSSCTVGSLYDRVGNEACETLACDFRIRFTRTNAEIIDGRNADADCVIDYYGSVGAYSTSPYTYALIGWGSTVYCGLSTGSIHTQFQVL